MIMETFHISIYYLLKLIWNTIKIHELPYLKHEAFTWTPLTQNYNKVYLWYCEDEHLTKNTISYFLIIIVQLGHIKFKKHENFSVLRQQLVALVGVDSICPRSVPNGNHFNILHYAFVYQCCHNLTSPWCMELILLSHKHFIAG